MSITDQMMMYRSKNLKMRIVKYLILKTESIPNIGKRSPVTFSLETLEEVTGYRRRTISSEIRALRRMGAIFYEVLSRLKGEYILMPPPTKRYLKRNLLEMLNVAIVKLEQNSRKSSRFDVSMMLNDDNRKLPKISS